LDPENYTIRSLNPKRHLRKETKGSNELKKWTIRALQISTQILLNFNREEQKAPPEIGQKETI